MDNSEFEESKFPSKELKIIPKEVVGIRKERDGTIVYAIKCLVENGQEKIYTIKTDNLPERIGRMIIKYYEEFLSHNKDQ